MLSAESAVALNLLSADGAKGKILIAASHDCDIANDNLIAEPTVEFLIGELIDKVDGSYTRAKNARTLHLEFETPEGRKAAAFTIRNRVEVQKEGLASHSPQKGWSHLSPKGVISLRWWLAARYFRSSFADTFETRLREAKLDEKIDKALSKHATNVHGIFFLVDDGECNNCSDEKSHELRAIVVYDSEATEEQIAAVKEATATITDAFKRRFFNKSSGEWKQIELVSCDAISDEVFSYAALLSFKQWRLEFRSLENDSQQLPLTSI